ncbi:hypothetical protein, partial [Paenibacillus sp. MY03]|uniref:hypothetical protein n=1 Tax=Paenibacillus sp. MY03 TaxID=302980 RepID=UPI001C4FF1E5
SKVVCVRYNLNRPHFCEIATVVSVTNSLYLTLLPSTMNRQKSKNGASYEAVDALCAKLEM